MAKQVQFRRGTTSEHSSFTGATGEITVDTDKDVAVIHDGSTAGGFPLAKQTSLDAKAAIDDPTFTTGITSPQVDITAQGDLRLQDSAGGQYVGLQAPATISSSFTLTMPSADGSANQVLQTDGSGVLSFADAGGGQTTVISTTTVSTAVANVGITLPTSGYTYLVIHFEGLQPATDGEDLDFNLSDNGGTGFRAIYWARGAITGSLNAQQSSGIDMQLNQAGVSNSTSADVRGFIRIHIPTVNSTTSLQFFVGQNRDVSNQNELNIGVGNLIGNSVQANFCKFEMSSGNINKGKFTLYGVA